MQPVEQSISAGGLRFSALELGDCDGYPVLALHGWMDNAASFIPLSEHLKGIRLIAVDLAGHGQSEWRAQGMDYCLWNYVEDTINIIEALGVKQLSIVGHSLGAIISVMVGATAPALVDKLVLLDGLCAKPADAKLAPPMLSSYFKARKKLQDGKQQNTYTSFDNAVAARSRGRFPLSMAVAELLVARAIIERDGIWSWRVDPRLSMPSPIRMTREQSLAFPMALNSECHLLFSKSGLMNNLVTNYGKALSHIQFYPFEGGHHFHMEEHAEAVATTINEVVLKQRE